jgi:hypothetical protein
VDVSLPTLLRRLGPRRWQARPTPERVLDWQAVAPFAEHATDGPAQVQLRASRGALHRLRPADLADLLVDLGRAERQLLLHMLEPGAAADALEEMEPAELENLLREAEPGHATRLVEEMEPDEAVDALRDLHSGERERLLAHMPADRAAHLRRLLAYPTQASRGPSRPPPRSPGPRPMPVVAPEIRAYFRDVADHLARVTEQITAFDALLDSILQAHLAQVTVAQNEDARKITAWAAINAVPTRVCGVYGMNFDHMPELRRRFGYPLVLATACFVIHRGFKRNGWL